MATPNKYIRDWNKIFLDTSILCNLFRSEFPDVSDPTVLFVRKLISFLSKNKASGNKDRVFLISTITISELLTREQDSDKIKKILRVLNSENVEFVDFDFETSLTFNRVLYPYLSKDALHARAKEFGFKVHEFMMAREWISKDLMILCSAAELGADVVLTVDKNTMYPQANDLNIFCALAFPELFTVFGTAVTSYDTEKVESFLSPQKNKKEAQPEKTSKISEP
jgi:predicted nucleic acid-binding protein